MTAAIVLFIIGAILTVGGLAVAGPFKTPGLGLLMFLIGLACLAGGLIRCVLVF